MAGKNLVVTLAIWGEVTLMRSWPNLARKQIWST